MSIFACLPHFIINNFTILNLLTGASLTLLAIYNDLRHRDNTLALLATLSLTFLQMTH